MQNKPDPLPVVVSGPDEMEAIFPNLPTLEAALVNQDFQKKPVTFQQGGDLRFVVDGEKVYTAPVGKARLYLVTKALPDAAPKKAGKFVMGEKFA